MANEYCRMTKDLKDVMINFDTLTPEEQKDMANKFFAGFMNHASKKLAENLIASTEINNDCTVVLDKIMHEINGVLHRIYGAIQQLEESKQVSQDAEFIENLNTKYNIINIYGASVVMQNIVDDVHNYITKIKMLQKVQKTGEEKLAIFTSIMSDVVHSIKLYHNIIGQTKHHVDQAYRQYQAKFFEKQEGFFGSVDTFNVQFLYKDNWLLTELYNEVVDKMENAVTSEDAADMIHIFLSPEYNAIHEQAYMTYEQSINYQNVSNMLLPFVGIIKTLQQYERSDTGVAVQTMVKDLISKPHKELIEGFLKKQQENKFMAHVLQKGEYVPSQTIKAPGKDEVGNKQVLKLKKEIFQDIDEIALLVQKNSKTFEESIDKIEMYYYIFNSGVLGDQRGLVGDKDGNDTHIIKKYIAALDKLKIKLSEYQKVYDKWMKGKATDTLKGDDVDNYSFATDQHGLIDGLDPQPLTKPAPVIGASVDQIKSKLFKLLDKDPSLYALEESYNGSEKNLLHNYIILGPFGSGKTALLRELGYNKDFISIATSYADIASMWYGIAEKNIKRMFEEAYQKHQETGKQVLLLVDEFDMFFSMSNPMGGNTKQTIQKQLQIVLDGVIAYPGVHLIGLSNVPQGIPMDIYRRAKTFVIDKLQDKEINELIVSRLGRYKLDSTMNNFLHYIKAEINDDKSQYAQVLKSLRIASPKIIATICKQVVDIYFEKIMKDTDKKKIASFAKKVEKLNKKKAGEEEYKKLFDQRPVSITDKDFIRIVQAEFDNPVIQAESKVYEEFYTTVESHIGNIKGSFQSNSD